MASVLLAAFAYAASTAHGEDAANDLRGRLVFFGLPTPENQEARAIVSMLSNGNEFRIELLEAPRASQGCVSRDGKTIAFNVSAAAVDGVIRSQALWIKEPGKGPRRLAEDMSLGGWHPSANELLAYRTLNQDGRQEYETLRIDAATGAVTAVEMPKDSFGAIWLPDGKSLIGIALNSQRTYDDPVRGEYPLRQLFFWNPSSRESRTFTPETDDCIWPSVSPNGKRIAFYLRRHTTQPHELLALANSDGSDVREFAEVLERTDTTVIRPAGTPRWSPDGSEIAWLRTIKAKDTGAITGEVLILRLDGSGRRRIAFENERWAYFDWVQ